MSEDPLVSLGLLPALFYPVGCSSASQLHCRKAARYHPTHLGYSPQVTGTSPIGCIVPEPLLHASKDCSRTVRRAITQVPYSQQSLDSMRRAVRSVVPHLRGGCPSYITMNPSARVSMISTHLSASSGLSTSVPSTSSLQNRTLSTSQPSKMSSQPAHPTLLIPGPIEFDDAVLQSMSHFRYVYTSHELGSITEVV